jgi:type IV pilus assembly protein PilP
MYKHSLIVIFTISILLFVGLVGCEGKPKAIAKKTNVVSQKVKIESNQQEIKSEKYAVEKKTIISEDEINTDNIKMTDNTENSKLNMVSIENKKVNEIAFKPEPDSATDESENNIHTDSIAINKMPIEPSQNENEDKEKRDAIELLASIHQEETIMDSEYDYDFDSLKNPFLPLFSDASAAPKEKKHKKQRDPKELTPLEKVDLSQLKLVATLRADSGNKALVEDSTGKGYVVKEGTYIGINSGSIVEITNKSIVVEEEIETLTGDVKIQKREIKLQKAPGE